MSKNDTEEKDDKVIVDDVELIETLELHDLLKRHHKVAAKIAALEAEKKSISAELEESFTEIGVDGIEWKDWRAVISKGNDKLTKTDPDLLRNAMGTIGKLDAMTIAEIFKAAQVPAPREGFVRVTYPENLKLKKVK